MTAPVPVPRSAATQVVASLTAIFVLSQFYRSAIAVIAPDIARDLALDPADLGLVGGAFFVAMAAMQLPVGILLDRFGARRTTPTLLMVAVAGALVFAHAQSLAMLVAGQLLIGFGCAGVFMGGLVIISRWFAEGRFGVIGSLMLAASSAGLLLSATPFAWASELIGWRTAMQGVAAVTFAGAALAALLVRDAPPGHDYFSRRRERLDDVVRGLRAVFADADLRVVLVIAFVSYSAVFVVRGLWGGPYLADVHGLDGVARGNVLLSMSVGSMVGLLIYGPLEQRIGRGRRLVLCGALVNASALLALALSPGLHVAVVSALFVVLAASGAYTVLLLAHGRALFPDELVGRAMTTVNLANFVGVGVLQMVCGVVIGLFAPVAGHPPEVAYRAVFAMIAVLLIAASLFYQRARDPRDERFGR